MPAGRRFLERGIFFPGGQAAPDMAFLLIELQNLLDMVIKLRIELSQTLCNILMDRTLGYLPPGAPSRFSPQYRRPKERPAPLDSPSTESPSLPWLISPCVCQSRGGYVLGKPRNCIHPLEAFSQNLKYNRFEINGI